MSGTDKPTFSGEDRTVRMCRVEVPHRNGARDVYFIREDHTAPWQALGDDVVVTPLEPYVPWIAPPWLSPWEVPGG